MPSAAVAGRGGAGATGGLAFRSDFPALFVQVLGALAFSRELLTKGQQGSGRPGFGRGSAVPGVARRRLWATPAQPVSQPEKSGFELIHIRVPHAGE